MVLKLLSRVIRVLYKHRDNEIISTLETRATEISGIPGGYGQGGNSIDDVPGDTSRRVDDSDDEDALGGGQCYA